MAADYGGWPFKNSPHDMTAAQRAYIAATREEHMPPEKEKPERISRERWQEMAEQWRKRKNGEFTES